VEGGSLGTAFAAAPSSKGILLFGMFSVGRA
jgi:hypothetical protein